MATNRRAGIVALSIDGIAYDVVGDAAYAPFDVKRESLVGQSGVQGYSEMPTTGYITMTLRDAGSLTVNQINSLTGSTLTLELANGKTVYGSGMWCTEIDEVNSQEGSFKAKFEGPRVDELTI